MAGFNSWTIDESEEAARPGLQSHQVKAAASPHMPLRQFVVEQASQSSTGNFQDLESLLEQLGAPPVFELGKPLPAEKYLPRQGLGNCPAAHNRALLDENTD